jgi:hypothetical protein
MINMQEIPIVVIAIARCRGSKNTFGIRVEKKVARYGSPIGLSPF